METSDTPGESVPAELRALRVEHARAMIAIRLLYSAHKGVVFDTPEDVDLQERVLASARDALGWDPVEELGDEPSGGCDR